MSNISPLSARIRFNPRTRGGCDPLFLYSMSGTRSFQSTHPWGVRPFVLCKDFNVKQFQSTHPWGCDTRSETFSHSVFWFQSTHPWGCDLIATSGTDEVTLFQSTHPWGVRRLRGRPASERSARFNPRTCEGCDIPYSKYLGCFRCFNPRTRGGCDVSEDGQRRSVRLVSIHAPMGGATMAVSFLTQGETLFQSTHL